MDLIRLSITNKRLLIDFAPIQPAENKFRRGMEIYFYITCWPRSHEMRYIFFIIQINFELSIDTASIEPRKSNLGRKK